MISLEDRQALAQGIDVAHAAGARLEQACEIVGIDVRTLQRWNARGGLVWGDGRPDFASVPPARIVPMLADEGVYLASESSFNRVLREQGQTAHRGRAKAPRPARVPTTHAALVGRMALAEGIAALDVKPVLHGDNGATLKATTVLAMLEWLGVNRSHSRPRVSNDNAYAESLFRTAKYRPEFPAAGFADLDSARIWAAAFVHGYNFEHRYSAIRYVTLAQRHAGDDQPILAARHTLYTEARKRWSRNTRDWSYINAVTLNPERDSVVKAHLSPSDTLPLAA
jgi:putative transposase